MIDYLVDSDLLIANGDLLKGDATLQNQKALLAASPGEYKQYPLAGVGIMNFLKSNDNGAALMRQIRQQFTNDGMTVSSLSLANGVINVVAPYANS
jgi:hypothetical protein